MLSLPQDQEPLARKSTSVGKLAIDLNTCKKLLETEKVLLKEANQTIDE